MRCGHEVPPNDAPILELTVGQRVVVMCIRAFHAQHGRIPRQLEWPRNDGVFPSAMQVKRLFGTWKAAIESAGFEPPAQGRKPTRESLVEVRRPVALHDDEPHAIELLAHVLTH